MSEGAIDRKPASERRPRPSRIASYPLVIAAALGAAVALIKIFEASLEAPWDALLIDRERGTYPITVQNVMWVVFMLGLGELFVRWREAQAERRQLRAGYLPEDETTVLQAPDLRQIYARARDVARPGSPGARRFLPRLIQRVAIQFQTSRSVEQASTLLNSSLELYLHEIDLRYSMTRYIIWLIPSLGFIGTVIGISLALAYAGEVDLQDPSLLAELTKRLAVAFNTTLLALVMSAVLVLIQHVVQAREEGVLNEVGQYCLDNLINRLYAG
ncbi:MAG: MotA/TolQ/ExbB proton channel family protein [Kiloniellales bacterium]|jgi:biopolymer transport protein ExbB/TolQ|nr:MotA/TolQ/ExbB proton channel family protein [Kiloniellales bacterium]